YTKRFIPKLGAETRLHSNIYRIGGEEFACLLPNTDQQAAQHYGSKLCEAIYDHHSILDYSPAIRVSVSIGCAEFDAAMLDAKYLYQHADDALYNAKLSGRNRVVSYA
ncbi:GGDEF domain-containing protein, partial [Salinivibrio sp. HTSP]|uniref:GGDEF domain-containing protein n=1 Tax=Salinivibrio sp. HTSP TaxID=2115977 RepID=UPI0012D776E8